MLVFAALLGVAAFGGYYAWQSPKQLEVAAGAGELDWLRTEFDLDADQFERIQAIHAEYMPICEALCDRVVQAKENLERVILAESTYSSEVERELERLAEVKKDCHRSMLQHVYEVASVMRPEQRKRYLEMARTQVTRQAIVDVH